MPVALQSRRPETVEEEVFASPLSCTFSDTLVTVEVHTPDPSVGHKNQYVFCGNNPVNFVDPTGLTDIPVGNEIYRTPSVSDAGHVHTFNGLDQGPHLHGPGGKKYFPRTGMIRESSGRWRRASNSFRKRFGAAARLRGLTFSFIMYIPDVIRELERALEGKEHGRGYLEQIQWELRNTPLMEWPPGSGEFVPNPYYEDPCKKKDVA